MKNGSIQIRISDILFILRKRRVMILVFTLLGVAFGILLTGMNYVQYSLTSFEVSGSCAITTVNPGGLFMNGPYANNNDFHLAEDMVDAVKYVLTSNQTIDGAINRSQLMNIAPETVKQSLGVKQYESTQILEITLEWPTAEDGVNLWNCIIDTADELIPKTLQLGGLAIVNEPSTKAIGVVNGSNSIKTIMLMAVLGLMGGLAYSVVELLVHPTLNNVRDVESSLGLETFGVIPHDRRLASREQSFISDESYMNSTVAQSYATAAYILRNRIGTHDDHHCFYVTSTGPREGKTMTASNLALQLSEMEHKTLLIDFNMRNPELGGLFLNEVDYAHSLNALYRAEITEQEAITSLTGNLDILPAVMEHKIIQMDSTVEELIRRLTKRYEYVIIDACSLGRASETLSLNQVADTVLFVVGYDTSTISDIRDALEKLDKSGVRVVGCVVNGVIGSGKGEKKATKKKKKKNKEEKFVTKKEKTVTDQNVKTDLTKPEEKEDIMHSLLSKQNNKKALSDREVISQLMDIGISGEWKNDDKDSENK